jgi:site-specific DNA recombinase
MKDLSAFKKFIKKHDHNQSKALNNKVWSYTRVSSKKQSYNYSLTDQREMNKLFAEENGYEITFTFGNTHESATSDFTRKEFNELITRVKRAKEKPFGILVHVIDRFSRTGGSAIGIVEQLVLECNVHLIEVSTGTDTTTEEGRLAIYEKLLDARRENFKKLKRTVPGMVRFVKSGRYLGTVPRGYDHFGTHVKDFSKREIDQRIVINEDGKKLRMAWGWKVQGIRDFEIQKKLEEIGLKIPLQRLSSMWRNTFYCGIQTNSLVGDDPVVGNWEPLITKEVFLKVQQIISTNHQGYTVQKQSPMWPLTGTLKCQICGTNLCGYRGKGDRPYYKCQKGHISFNAVTSKRLHERTGAHDLFISKLDEYILNPRFVQGFRIQMMKFIGSSTKSQASEICRIKNQLLSLEKKRDRLQETHYLENDPPKPVYEKLMNKIETEMAALLEKVQKPEVDTSNLGNNLNLAIEFSQNTSKCWESASVKGKKVIQDLVFPEGLVVDIENRRYLTSKVNALFAAKAQFIKDSEEQKKEIPVKNDEDSVVVAGTGFEPMTFGL